MPMKDTSLKLDTKCYNIEKKNPVNQIIFEVDLEPEAYARPRYSSKIDRFYNPKSSFKNKIKKEIIKQLPDDFIIIEGGIRLELEIYINPNKSICSSKLKRRLIELGILRPIIKPDFDNYAKLFVDAMNKVVFKDDGLIHTALISKYYTLDNPKYICRLWYNQTPIKCK